MPNCSVPRTRTGLRRAGPVRWLSCMVRRRLAGRLLPVQFGRRRHRRDVRGFSARSTRWLQLMVAVVLMAALFAVLLASA